MSEVREQIKDSIYGFSKPSEFSADAKIIFKDDFKGFDGHFDGNPILPGVCMIETAVVLYQIYSSSVLDLFALKHAKYFAMVKPNVEVDLSLTVVYADNLIIVKVLFTCEEKKAAQIDLIYKSNEEK